MKSIAWCLIVFGFVGILIATIARIFYPTHSVIRVEPDVIILGIGCILRQVTALLERGRR